MANPPIHTTRNNPTMFGANSVNHHAHHHLPTSTTNHFPPPPSVSQSNTWAGPYTYVPIAPEPVTEQHHVKRVRDQPVVEEQVVPLNDGMASPSSGKRQRPSNYRPPLKVDPKSVVAMTGSLVGGGENNKMAVRMRRELSGGQLDQFFRSHDAAMEDDTFSSSNAMRPRSMSF